MRKLIFGWLALAVALAVGHTAALNAWFSDVEVSSGNTFTAGTWAPPKPSLSLDPDDKKIKTGASQISHCVSVSNHGEEEIDVATGVKLAVNVVNGTDYVAGVDYEASVGDIGPGDSREFSFTVTLTGGWEDVPKGEEVKLRIEVIEEGNWPEHNVGRRAHLTIIKSK